MSTSLFNIFRIFGNYAKKNVEFSSSGNGGAGLIMLGCIIGGHLTYTLTSKNENEIIIKHKYKWVREGFTKFMIIDQNDTHYCVNNSFWLWKWDSIEDWNKVQLNQKIKINYYGVRIPELGVFPNVYHMSNETILE